MKALVGLRLDILTDGTDKSTTINYQSESATDEVRVRTKIFYGKL